jgi:hypothetical protein
LLAQRRNTVNPKSSVVCRLLGGTGRPLPAIDVPSKLAALLRPPAVRPAVAAPPRAAEPTALAA